MFTSAKEVMFSSALVCLFVSRITQKLIDRFSQNLLTERWYIGYGRNYEILDHVVLGLWLRLGHRYTVHDRMFTWHFFNYM